MTDLVERLRREADEWTDLGDSIEGMMLREAAAEIERLRTVLSALGTSIIEAKTLDEVHLAMDIARDALELK